MDASKPLDLREMMEMTKELAFSIHRVKEREQQQLLLGAVVKLTEIAKGNLEQVGNQSLESLLDNHLSLFSRNSDSRQLFSQDKENSEGLRRGGKKDNSRRRLRSVNERTMNTLRDSNKRTPICSLCCLPGHRTGNRCPVVTKFRARFIPAKEAASFAEGLGNPAFHLVEKPPAEDREPLKEWLHRGWEIPSNAFHLVIRRSFFPAQAGDSFQANPLEVTCLSAGGEALAGHEVCYFPTCKVSSWIQKNCKSKQRRKHLLSSLSDPTPGLSQNLYDYEDTPEKVGV